MGPVTRPLAFLLLAWTAAVTLVRISALASGPVPMRAHGERVFFGWAWRGSAVRTELRTAGSRLPDGKRVRVASPDPRYDPEWLHVMALYYLPRQVVVPPGQPAAPVKGEDLVLVGAGTGAIPPAAISWRKRTGEVFVTVTGAALVLLVGHAALGFRRTFGPSDLAFDGAVGLAVVCPLLFLIGLLGLPLTPAAVIAYEVVLATVLLVPRRPAPPSLAEPPLSDPLARACELAAVLAFAVACWKWARVPLWSWDHYAIWGMKARRIISHGRLDLAFLRLPALVSSVPAYPIGLPIAWRVLHAAEPGVAAFKASHALFAAGLLASLRGAALRMTGSRALAAALAGLVAISPLFWDTEAVGLAEMPLVFMAISSIALVLRAREDSSPSTRTWAAAGLALGFLSWIKAEGALLAFLLAGVALLSGRPRSRLDRARRIAAIVLPAGGLVVAAALARSALLASGVSFFEGDWPGRVTDRLRGAAAILTLLARELLQPDWMGVWPLAGAAFLFAIVKRWRASALLLAAVAAQMAAYAAVYFATYLDPAAHIRSSFFRIAAGLAPLAILGAGAALAARSPGPQSSPAAPAQTPLAPGP